MKKVPSQATVCGVVENELALVVDRKSSPSRLLLTHLDECLSCQAALSRYRRLLRLLADLQNETERLPEGMLADLVGGITRAAERRAIRDLLTSRRGFYLFSIAAAVLVSSTLVALFGPRSFRSTPVEGRQEESLSSGC
ncbi:MAG TPA: hypothetical protein VMU99_11145 [Acidimicrobiales bacterium]|nr:hypothetical protein [Acidimicrobiales bacterium]